MTYCATNYYYSSCKSNDKNAASISGRYSFDEDRNNTELNANGRDAGVAGKTVYLLDSTGKVVATTTTNDDGGYKFAQLKAGTYKVAFELAQGFNFAKQDVGDSRYDSDVNADGKTDWISLSSCQTVCDVDASVQRSVGRVTGSVFVDAGCDGINGITKTVPGKAYVIEAEAMCKSGGLAVAWGAQASGGKLVKLQCGTTGTLSDSFKGTTGTYDVTIRVQDENDGRSQIQLKVDGVLVNAVRLNRDVNGAGDDNGGFSDFVITGVKVNSGSSIQLVVNGDGGEYVRIDKITLQGQASTVIVPEPPKAGVKIVLLDSAGTVIATTYTDAKGDYKFDNVPTGQYRIMGEAPDGSHFTLKDAGGNDAIDSDVGADGKSDLFTVSAGGTSDIDLGLCDSCDGGISGRYFFDAGRDNTDNGDAGVSGKTVTLYKADGVTVVATTTTDSNGNYAFDDVAQGNYVVGFQSSAAEQRTFVTANVGDDAFDSDVNAAGKTAVITVGACAEVKDVDAGVLELPGALKGRYFFDAGRDGTDNGDAGVQGKLVTLYAADGVTVVATTTTDSNGDYAFTGLIPGSYVVGFADSAAEGRVFTAQDVGGDDTIDSDANVATGKTGTVVVLAGQVTQDVDVGVYVPNKAPIALDDAGKTCSDETTVLNLLANDSDPDGTPVSVVSISDEDQTVGVGGTLTLASGALVTLNADGTVTYDGIAAHAELTIGHKAVDSFSYTITDGELTAQASAKVDVCGALNTPQSIDERVFEGATATFTVDPFNAQNAINGFSIQLNSINIPDDFHSPVLTVANLGGPGFQAAYCIDYTQNITTRIVTNAKLMVATAENALSAGLTAAAADHMDSVNWLLNQHFTTVNNGDGTGKTYTDMEVQEAIYILLNGDTFFINNPAYGNTFVDDNDGVREPNERATEQNAQEIANLALTHGDGFRAGAGDILGLILDPTAPAGQEQPFLIGIQFNLFAETCLCG